MSLNSIEIFLEKIGHSDLSISSRAISNLEIKINLQTIKLNEITFNTLNNLILSLIDWIAKNPESGNLQGTIKAFFLISTAFDHINEQIYINLKAKNFLGFVENISNFSTSQNLSEICENISKKFVTLENSLRNKADDSGYKKDKFESFAKNETEKVKEFSYQNKTGDFHENSLNNNESKYSNNFNNSELSKNSNSNVNNNFDNFKYSNFNNSNKNNLKNFLSNNTQEHLNQDSIHKGTLYPSNFSANSKENNRNNAMKNNISNNSLNSPLTKILSFPLIKISKSDEQIFYDANINLKFGDSLQINKTLNNIYFYLMEEYPIEYFLQNSQILKSLLIILEKSNHLEYGQILYRILNKATNLLEKKLNFQQNNFSMKFNSIKKEELNKQLFYYPEESNKINKENPKNSEDCLSIRDFLIISTDALILSLKNPEKFSFNLILLQKNLTFFKKIFSEIDENWKIIFQNILKNLFNLISEYKKNQINFNELNIIFLKFALDFNDFSFLKIFENFEILNFLKEILFIFNDKENNLGILLLEKIKKILEKIQKKNLKSELSNKLKELILHYEKAEVIKSSIEISKKISNFKMSAKQIDLKEKKAFFSVEDLNFINENFNNLLITFKYFIDINDEKFVKNIQKRIKNFEREDIVNNKIQQFRVKEDSEKDLIRKNYGEESDVFDNDILNDEEYFNFFEFIGISFNHANLNENYFLNSKDDNNNNNKENSLYNSDNNNLIEDNFTNLIRLLNTLDANNIFKYSTYLDFYNEIKSITSISDFSTNNNNNNNNINKNNPIINNNNFLKSNNFLLLINSKPEILLGILNDLSNAIDLKHKKLEFILREIIHEIFSKAILLEENFSSKKPKFKINKKIYKIFEIFPLEQNQKTLKFFSLNSRIEKKFSSEKKLLKYLRLLFSTSENIRLNAIHFFKNLFNLNSAKKNLEENEIEFLEFSTNYEKLKKLDLIYSIQTADGEYGNIFCSTVSEEIEFFPLWNILQSKKLDVNLKTSAIEQLINLSFCGKYKNFFCGEIIFFIEDLVFKKLLEFKNLLENYFVFGNSCKNGVNSNDNSNEGEFVRNYSNVNNFLDEFYLDKNLNFISALFKLMNFIILNNSDDERIVNFLCLKNNKNLFELLQCVLIQLFPNENIEILLNTELKKNRSKHLLSVNLVYFIFLTSFNLKNSFDENLTKFLSTENLNEKNPLSKTYSFLEINKTNFFNICPIKNLIKFSIIYNDEKNQKNFLNCEDYFKMDKHIIEFIRYKRIYLNQKNSENSESQENFLMEIFPNLNLTKKNIKKILAEFPLEQNYLELFLQISKIFEFYLLENFIKKINSEIFEKNKNKIFNEINKFEENESNILVQILLFIKTIIPNSLEEKNILIDILNSIKIFLFFLKENFSLENFKEKNLREKKGQINFCNFKENFLKEEKFCLFLPLCQKGLNDAVNNYLNFICNSKIFLKEISSNLENQNFLIEIFELILSFPEIFDCEFYLINFETLIFLIKFFVNSTYNCENLYLIRLKITQIAIKLFDFLGFLKEKNFQKFKKIENFFSENNEFFEILIDSIEFFIGNYKDEKAKKYKNFYFNRKNNFENIDNFGINFKEFCLLKNNLILLKEILRNFNTEDLEDFIVTKSNVFSFMCLDLLGNLEENKAFEENDINESNVYDNTILIDIIILTIDIFEKIKYLNPQISLIKLHPNLFEILFNILLTTNPPSLLTLKITNFLIFLLEIFIKNTYNILQSNKDFSRQNSQKLNFSGNNESEHEKSNFNVSNINPNFENFEENEDNENFEKISSRNFHQKEEIQIFVEDIFEKNSEIFDISNLLLLINLIKRNLKNTNVLFNLFSLCKVIIEFFEFKNSFGNENKNLIFDQILNSAFLEIQIEIVNFHIEKFEENLKFLEISEVKNLQKSEKNVKIYDKENLKLLKIQEILEICILINEIFDFFRNLLNKNSDFIRNYNDNKVFVIENLNSLFKFMLIFNEINMISNKPEFVLFFKGNNENNFSDIFYNTINNFFCLIHALYYKNPSIINEDFLEITFYAKNFLINSVIKNENSIDINNEIYNTKEFEELKEIQINKIFEENNKTNLDKENTQNKKTENKTKNLINLCYNLLTFNFNKKNYTTKVYYAKILPYLIETIIHQNLLLENFNQKRQKIQIKKINLTNEGDTILQMISGLKEIYQIKYDNYDSKINYKFQMQPNLLNEKNSLISAISSILLVSQISKKIFIKSNFIGIFLDYIKQISESLLEINLDFKGKNSKMFSGEKINFENENENDNFDAITQITEKNYYFEYLINEYNSILVLLKNLFFGFDECEEKRSLFLNVEYFDENLASNFSNVNKENESKKILSKKSSLNNSNLSSINNSNSTNKFANSKNFLSKNKQNFKKDKENCKDNNPANEISYSNNTNLNEFNSNSNSKNSLAKDFLITIYEIFNDALKLNLIFEEYFKMLINIISANEYAKKSFILSISNPEILGKKDSFLIVLLDFLQKRFFSGSFIFDKNQNGINLFIKLLKCLFQNKQIVLFLIKIKFLENFKKDLLNFLQNKKFYISKSNQICLGYLLELFISLSFDSEIRKKIADKETIEVLTSALLKIKNEEIWFNLLFILRNLSFANQNKNFFLVNEELLGTLFAFMTSGEKSVKIKFMISHLIWILVYNNQSLKGILSKEAFRSELIAMQLHLQKDFDMLKYMNNENVNDNENDNENYKENVNENEIYKFQLEQASLNFKKILHIIDH